MRFTADQISFSGFDMHLGRPRKKWDTVNIERKEMKVTEIRFEAWIALCLAQRRCLLRVWLLLLVISLVIHAFPCSKELGTGMS
jgi:hypothetical protein